jgi:type IV secretion system protein VirB10
MSGFGRSRELDADRALRGATDEPGSSERFDSGELRGAAEVPPAGDRGRPAVQSVGTASAHVARVLGVGLLGLVVGGFVIVYAARVFNQPGAQRNRAQEKAAQRAEGDLPLPALGSLEPFRRAARAAHEPPTVQSEAAPVWGSALSPAPPVGVLPAPRSAADPRHRSAAERAEHRRLMSPVFSHGGLDAAQLDDAREAEDTPRESAESDAPYPARAAGAGSPGAATPARSFPATTAVQPPMQWPSLSWLLPKGASLDCTLETAIDSTLSGMTTCVTAVDVFGADGQQVVLPRGTQLVGETRGTVRAGQARVQVLWTEARTPTGIMVALASPGTDPLGRAGLPGQVDRQFGERFGAAVLLSIIEGAISAAVASQQSHSGAVYISPSAAPDVMTEMLKETSGMPPRIVKAQGDRVAVLVARNIDFQSVYRRPGPADGGAAHGNSAEMPRAAPADGVPVGGH